MLLLKTTGILHSLRTLPKSDQDKVKGVTAVQYSLLQNWNIDNDQITLA